MVLKKSNSALNSGATQRIHDGGVWVPGLFDEMLPTKYITLESHTWDTRTPREIIDRHSDLKAVTSAENLIYSYLTLRDEEFPGGLRQIPRTRNKAKFLSLNKNKLWLVPDRLESLMKPKNLNVIEEISSLVDLKISRVETRQDTRRPRRSQTWTSQNLMENGTCTGHTDADQLKINRSGSRGHTRGIQRPAMWNRETPKKHRSTDTPECPGESKPQLHITLHDTSHVDSRCANLNLVLKKHGLRTYNGPRRCSQKRKGYNREALYRVAEEIQEGLLQECDMECRSSQEYHNHCVNRECCDTDNNFTMTDDVDCDNARVPPLRSYSLSEFCTTHGRQSRKKEKSDRPKKSKESQQWTKGCVQYISKEDAFSFLCTKDEALLQSYVILPHLVSDASGADESTTQTQNLTDAQQDNAESNKQDNVPPGENFELVTIEDITALEQTLQNRMRSHDDSFVPVYINNYEMSNESGISVNINNTYLPITSTELKSAHTRCCFVQHGNCSPPHFSIELGHLISEGMQCHLVARNASDGEQWTVALFSTSDSTDDDYLKLTDDFNSRICRLGSRELDMEHITQLAVDTLLCCHKDSPNEEKQSPSSTVSLKVSPETKPIWADLCNRLPDYDCRILSRNQALADLLSDSSQVVTVGSRPPKHQLAQVHECGICDVPFQENDTPSGYSTALTLTPCAHTFCIDCWRSHIYHAIRRGHSRIFCMELKCQSEVAEALVMTLIPYPLASSWRTRMRDRLLETSPAHAWCPNVRCDKVASTGRLHPKSGYGQPVACDCGHIWCHNCQAAPHWPLSCSQALAYNNILAKSSRLNQPILSLAKMEVSLRKCPKCSYPIEKNKGCPHMFCSMCSTSFCWNCAQPFGKHINGKCQRIAKDETYVLENHLVVEHPIFFYLEKCMTHGRKVRDMSSLRVASWLNGLRQKFATSPRTITAWRSLEEGRVPVDSLALALDCVTFLKVSHTLMEHVYVLLGFARRGSKCPHQLVQVTERLLDCLGFVASRVEIGSVHKSFLAIGKAEKRLRFLIPLGDRYVKVLARVSLKLQMMAKDVKTTWAMEDDLRKYIRYI